MDWEQLSGLTVGDLGSLPPRDAGVAMQLVGLMAEWNGGPAQPLAELQTLSPVWAPADWSRAVFAAYVHAVFAGEATASLSAFRWHMDEWAKRSGLWSAEFRSRMEAIGWFSPGGPGYVEPAPVWDPPEGPAFSTRDNWGEADPVGTITDAYIAGDDGAVVQDAPEFGGGGAGQTADDAVFTILPHTAPAAAAAPVPRALLVGAALLVVVLLIGGK